MSQENFYWDAVFVHVQVKYGIHSNLCIPHLFVRTCVQLPHDCTYLWLIIQKLLLKLHRKTSSLLLVSATTPMDMLSFLLFKMGNCHISWDLWKPSITVKPPTRKEGSCIHLTWTLFYYIGKVLPYIKSSLICRQDRITYLVRRLIGNAQISIHPNL